MRQALEAARVADAPTAELRKASNERAKMQLLESESRLGISTGEGLGREQGLLGKPEVGNPCYKCIGIG